MTPDNQTLNRQNHTKHIYSAAARVFEQIITHEFISLEGRKDMASSITKESHGETEPNGSLHAAMRTLKSKGGVKGKGKKTKRRETLTYCEKAL